MLLRTPPMSQLIMCEHVNAQLFGLWHPSLKPFFPFLYPTSTKLRGLRNGITFRPWILHVSAKNAAYLDNCGKMEKKRNPPLFSAIAKLPDSCQLVIVPLLHANHNCQAPAILTHLSGLDFYTLVAFGMCIVMAGEF